jgi:MarR family transcriptional regulator, organic hydroperoxide resistance regulator
MTAMPLPLERQLCYSLYAASMAVTRTYKPMLDALGLTYPQYLILLALWDEDGLGIGTIAERLALESSTVTPLVKRLEAAGLVARQRDTADERRVHVRLTKAGVAMRARCTCLGETLVAKAGLPLEELAALHAGATRLRQALSANPAAT